MKTINLPKIILLLSLVTIILTACATYQEPSPIATILPQEADVPATPTLEIPTRELPDKIDKLTPITPIEKEPIDMTPISPADLPTNLQEVVNQAISALAEKLSIDPEEIQVISAESVVWSDSSLGCPQPGMNYLMVLTDGYRVVLTVDEEPYYYHANQRGYGLFCDNPSPPYSEGAVDR
jgi:hypothetical protein